MKGTKVSGILDAVHFWVCLLSSDHVKSQKYSNNTLVLLQFAG